MELDPIHKLFYGVVATLLAAGVVGIWSMSNSVARMDERMSNYIEVQRETNAAVFRRLEDQETRIRAVERKTPEKAPQ